MRNAFSIMPVKTDRKDAHGIAELLRLGWFRPVHCKSLPAQETRVLLSARKLVQKQVHVEDSGVFAAIFLNVLGIVGALLLMSVWLHWSVLGK